MKPAGRTQIFAVFILLVVLLAGIWPNPAFAAAEDRENILVFWTEGERLKAVTLVCVQGSRGPLGIVAIPVHVRLDGGGTGWTVAEAYARLGREGLTAQLEYLFRTPISRYLSVDQATLDKVSSIIGPVMMGDRPATMAEVFEGTYTGGEIEPQAEIRCLAARLTEPRVVVKAPQLVWLFSSEVKTNLGYRNIWNIYRAVAEKGPGILNKKALTGKDCWAGSHRYREVAPEAWVNVLNEVSRA